MYQQKTSGKGRKILLISCKLMLDVIVIELLAVLKRRAILIVEFLRMIDWMVMDWKKMLSISCRLILEVIVKL